MRPLVPLWLAAAPLCIVAQVGCLEYGAAGAPCVDDDECAEGRVCVTVASGGGACLRERPPDCSTTVDVVRDVLLRDADDIATLLPPDDDRCLRIDGSVSLIDTSLDSLGGLERISEISGDLIVRENAALRDLEGLAGLTSVGGRVELLENHALTGVGLHRLTRAGELWLTGTSDLTSIAGLSALEVVDGRLWIANHAALRDVGALPKLSSVGSLDLDDNPALVELEGLSALETVGGAMSVSRNTLLPTLAGLGALRDVGTTLSIEDNPALPNCEALSLAGLVSPESTSISGNDEDAVCP